MFSLLDVCIDPPSASVSLSARAYVDAHRLIQFHPTNKQDRTYVPQHNKTKVYDLGLQIFRDSVARHPQVGTYG